MTAVKSQSRRSAQAAGSRRKILQAAASSFVEFGYHGATMGDIARRSGFAVQTVSYFFGTKPRLLAELIETTVVRERDVANAHVREQWEHAMAHSDDGPLLIDRFVARRHPIREAVSPLLEAARIGALTDAEVDEVHRSVEERRASEYAHLSAKLAEHDALREGLTQDRATDITLSIAGPELYLALANGRAWSGEDIREWTSSTLKQLLVA
ncbi:TetR/AcrR family transcriptional regulator [Microbacterium sp. H1-D42]|uniref:TetR/AcrR family transcriptional regulator n=1 Tax=Microbacterium sp. H1-D42 TaxID=2925844 RepID=UPI001F537A08|nr:TetR/AcrR family transcriptional regulator [Microbacterium sp. H1-D42]UNK69574.1 TetR/AcrR family transcriptional regulator [Microbacterium sp. H1-D42]